ncbi:DUF590-domain-containing protein [Lactarius vividus]|nr:DUF590-domain-containing protein [Lactarius vividus]
MATAPIHRPIRLHCRHRHRHKHDDTTPTRCMNARNSAQTMRDIDLVVVFRASSIHLTKQQARIDAQHAEDQYSRLLHSLRNAGLHAVGRRGERQGQLIILVSCPDHQLQQLVQRERYSDFLHGLSTPVPASPTAPRASERLRLVYSYVTATPSDGGLGIHPEHDSWSRIESIMALHDPDFNDRWIRTLTTSTSTIGHGRLDEIRTQVRSSTRIPVILFNFLRGLKFGEAVALYFAFLSSYTRALLFISVAGLANFYFGRAYSILYSSLLFFWSLVFVEYWRIRERIYSAAWGCLGSVRVEHHRPRYADGHPWWKRELKVLVSVPVIALFASVLAVLLTAIFVFEAFVTTLYTGPGHRYISFAPTIIFAIAIPRFLAIYRARAQRLTQWENHKHQSTFDASLTTKTFALSSIVAYLGLALSAFVYVPFGETAISHVQRFLSLNPETVFSVATFNDGVGKGLFVSDQSAARAKLNPSRLQGQMFAYTVTNQAVNFFLEVGLPFITRAFALVRSGKYRSSLFGMGNGAAKKKRVGFEDDKNGAARDEREFLERVRREVSLPEYDLFDDYNEMVTQFGYVALWSTIWPLAPVMALLNNVVEFRSDAFKLVTHFRRPLPKRTDTIGPWLDCLSFLSWLSALTNSALVFLFHRAPSPASESSVASRALFIALAASHGYIVLRAVVRHLLERVMWVGSAEKAHMDTTAREVKERYLQSVSPGFGPLDPSGAVTGAQGQISTPPPPPPPPSEFWEFDEGLDEIRKGIKDS